MDELRRRMFEANAAEDGWQHEGWPRAAIYDAGDEILVKAELPGVAEKTLNLSIHEDVLTVSGERPVNHLEGYARHRNERATTRFSRSFTLPNRVDTERTSAELKDGILTVKLPKHPESKPRQITVRAS
jgi:HSP20 family protein